MPLFPTTDLKKQRDALHVQIDELLKKRRKTGQDEHLMGQVQAFETQLSALKDDLSSANQGIESCEAELANLASSKVEVDEDYQQTLQALSKAQKEVSQLDGVIKKVEKEVFADLCKKIKISSIREYEESALQTTRAASDKALELSTAKAKSESLYVVCTIFHLLCVPTNSCPLFFSGFHLRNRESRILVPDSLKSKGLKRNMSKLKARQRLNVHSSLSGPRNWSRNWPT